jgi:hypothetical protein
MRAAQVNPLRISSGMAAIWIVLSGIVVRAEDLPPEADRVIGKNECWLLLGQERMPCGAAKVIAPTILRPDGAYKRCVTRRQTASGQVFDVPTCEQFCYPDDGPGTLACITIDRRWSWGVSWGVD